jgi:hypothetical protein
MQADEDLRYPYGARPLRPAWRSVKARSLAGSAVAASALGSWTAHRADLLPNDIALLTVLPAMLAIPLAFAPEPRTRLGTMSKDLLCIAAALSPLVFWAIHYLILGVPLLLAWAVAMDRLIPPSMRVPERFRLQAGAP